MTPTLTNIDSLMLTKTTFDFSKIKDSHLKIIFRMCVDLVGSGLLSKPVAKKIKQLQDIDVKFVRIYAFIEDFKKRSFELKKTINSLRKEIADNNETVFGIKESSLYDQYSFNKETL